jgi:serine/threonine protein kinase
LIGQLVGNYRITGLLGEGGMGAVYLAEHPGIGRKAAVKVLHPHLTRDSEMAVRFFNEARAANAIRHPGIVEVFDFGTLPSGVSYIIMEFLSGDSLAKRLRAGRMAMETAVRIAAQAADVLGAAHAVGIVHRDLKPDNLYLAPDPRNPGREMVKVLDFGIAKLGGGPTDAGSVKTRTGAVMGTPIYMSPEQCRGTREVDRRTDIYALGVILYEMLCGTPPFVSTGQGELMYLHISEPPPPPRTKNPVLPERLEAVVLRALAKDPAKRFQTMADLAKALAGEAMPTDGAAPDRVVSAERQPIVAPGGRGPIVPKISQTTLSASPSVIERALTTRKPGRGGLLISGAVVLSAAAAYVVIPRLRHPAELVPPAAVAPTIPAVAEPSSPSVVTPTPSIAVSLTSEPAGARVIRDRDDAVIGVTPLKESWPVATGVEKLRLELDGYQPENVIVPLDRGVGLSIALRRIAAPPTHRRPASSHPASAAPAPTPPHVAPSVTPAPPVTPPVPTKPRPKAEPLPL